jgi:putative ABC transport system permease protein
VRLTKLVLSELGGRKLKLVTALLAVSVGVAIVVSVRTVLSSYRAAVDRELAHLGADLLVIPEGLSPAAFHTLRFGYASMPEGYVSRLVSAGLVPQGAVGASLVQSAEVGGRRAVLEGVRPSSPQQEGPDVSGLAAGEVLVGSELAERERLGAGDPVSLFGQPLKVAGVLEETGTIADVTLFAGLDTAQRLSAMPGRINLIRIRGTDRGLAERISAELPGVRVLNRSKVVQARASTAALVERYSLVLSFVIVLLGTLSIANYMMANVRERGTEIGTLIALGATPACVCGLFLGKALVVGLLGGALGYIMGSALAVVHGPGIVNAAVLPKVVLVAPALGIACAASLVASAWPAWRAARLDPVEVLRQT